MSRGSVQHTVPPAWDQSDVDGDTRTRDVQGRPPESVVGGVGKSAPEDVDTCLHVGLALVAPLQELDAMGGTSHPPGPLLAACPGDPPRRVRDF